MKIQRLPERGTRQPEWKRIAQGGVVTEPGSSARVLTGGWRTNRPDIDFANCSHCMICWVLCPDSALQVYREKLTGVDLDHCKGCGICAVECPRHCIRMVPEVRAP